VTAGAGCMVEGGDDPAGSAQSQDFLKPTQTGPFQVNGLSYAEFSLTGPQTGFTDPVNLGTGFSVPTLDQIVTEIKATGTNLVKINLVLGQQKSTTDNAYDLSVPFPLPGRGEMRKHEVQSEQPKTLVHMVLRVVGQRPDVRKSILQHSIVKRSRYVLPGPYGHVPGVAAPSRSLVDTTP
jgi:hypothetical protein